MFSFSKITLLHTHYTHTHTHTHTPEKEEMRVYKNTELSIESRDTSHSKAIFKMEIENEKKIIFSRDDDEIHRIHS